MSGNIKIEHSTDYSIVKEIMTNPTLMKVSLPPEDQAICDDGKWEADPSYTYVLIYEGDKVAGLIRYQSMTNVMIHFHFHLLPEYWGSGVSDKAEELLFKYFRENTHYKKAITFTPWECKEVQSALARGGYEFEGILTNAIYWNNKIQHLIIAVKEI